jgi:RNA polymerase-binding transcription factor DksA
MTTEYKQKLEEEKAILMSELASLGNRDAKTHEWEATGVAADPSEIADSNSNADRFEDFEEKSALITPLEAKLKQVEEALERIENGTFGKCRVCHGPIGIIDSKCAI